MITVGIVLLTRGRVYREKKRVGTHIYRLRQKAWIQKRQRRKIMSALSWKTRDESFRRKINPSEVRGVQGERWSSQEEVIPDMLGRDQEMK